MAVSRSLFGLDCRQEESAERGTNFANTDSRVKEIWQAPRLWKTLRLTLTKLSRHRLVRVLSIVLLRGRELIEVVRDSAGWQPHAFD